MKRLFSLFLCIILITLPFFFVTGYASYNDELDSSAQSVLLMSLDDGTVIFDRNPDLKTQPGALTKIVTLIVALKNCEDLDAKITIPDDDILLLKRTYSSNAALKAGEEFTVRELLSCMMVKSANDAANVIADYIGKGSVDSFVTMMNDFVASLGCKNTHFVNAHGLDDDGQYTTANDLFIICKAGLEIPVFMEICNEYKLTLPATAQTKERTYVSTNWLINPGYKTYYYEYAQGIKTSTSLNDTRSVVAKATKDGYNYLVVVLDAPWQDVNEDGNNDNTALLDAKRLLRWTFKNIKLEKITDTTQIVKVIDVKLSFKTDHVRLVPKEDVNALVPSGTGNNSVLIQAIEEETPNVVNAPIKKGEVLGKAKILYAEKEIATVDLVAAESVNANIFLWILNVLKNIITSPIFIVAAVLAIGLIIVSRMKRRQRLEEQGREHYAPKLYQLDSTKPENARKNPKSVQKKKPVSERPQRSNSQRVSPRRSNTQRNTSQRNTSQRNNPRNKK